MPGTHDITGAVVEEENSIVNVMLSYCRYSSAKGAVMNFVFINDAGVVDLKKSVLSTVDAVTSHNYSVPFGLSAGMYRVFMYDIEQDGTLSNGVGYPAVRNVFTASQGYQGKYSR